MTREKTPPKHKVLVRMDLDLLKALDLTIFNQKHFTEQLKGATTTDEIDELRIKSRSTLIEVGTCMYCKQALEKCEKSAGRETQVTAEIRKSLNTFIEKFKADLGEKPQ